MPPQRTRGASTSKKNENAAKGEQDLQIYMESGETYRPFTDPGRIAKNDAKKSSKIDVRARVHGVPDKFLGVIKVEEEKTPSSSNDTRDTAQDTPEDGLDAGSSAMIAPQQSAFHVEIPEENRCNGLSLSDEAGLALVTALGPCIDHQHLRVQIPNSSLAHPCVSAYPASAYHSTVTGSPISAINQSITSLSFPSTVLSGFDDPCEAYSPEFPGLNNGQIVNTGLDWSSPDTPDLDPSCGSPISISTQESNECPQAVPLSTASEYCGEHVYGSFNFNGSPSIPDANSADPSALSFGSECFAGSSTIMDTDTLVTTEDADLKNMTAEAQKIALGMHFNEIDLQFLDSDHDERKIFSVTGNPDAFLTSVS